jgi:hypothetical protein
MRMKVGTMVPSTAVQRPGTNETTAAARTRMIAPTGTGGNRSGAERNKISTPIPAMSSAVMLMLRAFVWALMR